MAKPIKKLQNLLNQIQVGNSWTTGETALDKTEDQIRNIIFGCHHVPDTVWDVWDYSPPSALTYALDINNSRKYAYKIIEMLKRYEDMPYKQIHYKSICKLVWSIFQYDPESACRYLATMQQRQGFVPSYYDELVHQHKKFDEKAGLNSFFSYNADLEEVGLDERALILGFSDLNTLNILNGKKTIELRKNKPRFLDFVLIYNRETKHIVGSFNGSLICKKSIKDWEELQTELNMSTIEISSYLNVYMGYGITIKNVKKFVKPIPHSAIPGFNTTAANKEFRYLSSSQINSCRSYQSFLE
ncbi:hypothetical protein CrV_gp034 [Cylindrospermopsis raciborskii virus RM-2018a]|jgi:predicted transcriptional regulator|nr:hypothetical protein CrV_gp034 [Cylindrospermopsis raciborskii virus RM-2018a]WHL30601.1 hypothetical protein CrLKS4_g35 [Cylindrospermopsis phage Cr-LKS4]